LRHQWQYRFKVLQSPLWIAFSDPLQRSLDVCMQDCHLLALTGQSTFFKLTIGDATS
jgi:hypothetical protein